MEVKNKNHRKIVLQGIHLTSVGWELALPIFGGVFLGYQIDRLFEVNYTFTLVFLLLGIFTGYYSLFKYIELELLRIRSAKRQKQKEDNI